MTSEAAAPYAEATVDLPRYTPINTLPIVKSNDATVAPIQTSLQAIFVAGRNLKIIARSRVITPNDRRAVADSSKATGPGSRCPTNLAAAPSAALITSDTMSRKPVPRTRAKEKNRLRIALTHTLSDLVRLTF